MSSGYGVIGLLLWLHCSFVECFDFRGPSSSNESDILRHDLKLLRVVSS